jgi:hypothetical protein
MGRHFRGSVYQKIHHGQLANYMEKGEKQRARKPSLLMYKTDQVRESLGHSNFRVVVGQ